jgi:hypothetical protein
MIHGLEGLAGGHGAVPDHRHHAALDALPRGGEGHAQGGADGGAGVAHAEGIVGAFGALGKARGAVLLADPRQRISAPGEDLVAVALVAHVPHQSVIGGVEHIVQGDGQFHRTQVGRQVAAAAAQGVDQEGA